MWHFCGPFVAMLNSMGLIRRYFGVFAWYAEGENLTFEYVFAPSVEKIRRFSPSRAKTSSKMSENAVNLGHKVTFVLVKGMIGRIL